MCEYLKKILDVDKKENFSQSDMSSKIKELIKKESFEYPTFALTTVVMDSFASGTSVFKLTKEPVVPTTIQSNFKIML